MPVSMLARRARSVRGGGGVALLVGTMLVTAVGAAVLPAPRVVRAATATALQDLTVYAGPGTEYEALTYAPVGASLSVDGDAVNDFYPVTYDGVSGWAATWTVSVDGEPVAEAAAPSETSDEASSDDEAAEEAGPPPAPRGGYSEEQIIDIIYEAADRYNQPREDMLRVARCESGLDPNAINVGGDTHGLFQFLPSTFASTPYAEYDIYDPWANANAAGWMWSEGRRNEWVCQ